jgi:hypothetical protein
VVNDGELDSDPDMVKVWVNIPENHPPVAKAGPDQTVDEGAIGVQLDGSASSDPDGDDITYLWTAPAGITLSDATSATPTFDVPEDPDASYKFKLVVNDGKLDSDPDMVVIYVDIPVNNPPIANAGPDQTVDEGAIGVQLDGSASSDPDGDVITYLWTAPAEITLSDATSATPTFDVPEDPDASYEFTLVVNDGELDSDPDMVVVNLYSTGVDYDLLKKEIKIFPNPTHSYVFVEIPENANCICNITITDGAGKVMKVINNNGNDNFKIDVSRYPAGMYYLLISNKHFRHTEKIIKL